MKTDYSLLLVDSDEDRRKNLQMIFDFLGEKTFVASHENWHQQVQTYPKIAAVICDTKDETTYQSTLTRVKSWNKSIPVVIVEGHACMPEHIEAIAVAKLKAPFHYAEISDALGRCKNPSLSENTTKLSEENIYKELVGESEKIKKVKQLIQQVSDRDDVSVLILGESGTGKEIVARSIHMNSLRRNKGFIPINCGAIPSELLESELFGHEKGAFTGAITTRQGRFELAQNGTLFLDEIGDMPLNMQVKLLRVLQEKCFERIGSNKSVQSNVRIIAATHRNLEKQIENGAFREDLYYRLNVFPIEIPPLRERQEDIPRLLEAFCEKLKKDKNISINFESSALQCLQDYSWPGNVRELANLVERLSILHPNQKIDVEKLPEKYRISKEIVSHTDPFTEQKSIAEINFDEAAEGFNLKEHIEQTEIMLIKDALEKANWNVSRASENLQIRRTTLIEKMKKYALQR